MNINKHPQEKGMNQILIETTKQKCPLLLIMLARPCTKYKYDIDNLLKSSFRSESKNTWIHFVKARTHLWQEPEVAARGVPAPKSKAVDVGHLDQWRSSSYSLWPVGVRLSKMPSSSTVQSTINGSLRAANVPLSQHSVIRSQPFCVQATNSYVQQKSNVSWVAQLV